MKKSFFDVLIINIACFATGILTNVIKVESFMKIFMPQGRRRRRSFM
jgi:hypothetical protein